MGIWSGLAHVGHLNGDTVYTVSVPYLQYAIIFIMMIQLIIIQMAETVVAECYLFESSPSGVWGGKCAKVTVITLLLLCRRSVCVEQIYKT